MSIRFEDSSEIKCSIDQVKESLLNLGEHYVGIVSLFPGLKDIELVDQGIDFVTIRTNEGLMQRTNISKLVEDESVIVEFDEEYQVGREVTVKSHYQHEFTAARTGVKHRTAISDVSAPGIMGFFYRKFGKSSTGKATLRSYKILLENSTR